MKDTPRTKEALDAASRTPDGRYSTSVPPAHLVQAMYDHACTLERELNEAREALSGRTVSCSACNQAAIERDEAREAARIMAKAILAREELNKVGILFVGEGLRHRVKETHQDALTKAKEVLP